MGSQVEKLMSQQTDTSRIHIDSVHSRAICEEVGYRLRQSLKNQPAEAAPHLSKLLKQMRLQEVGKSPPLAPLLGFSHRRFF
jgi:hypothetical protein